MNEENQDLSLVPTEALLHELVGRFEHVVFRGIRKETERNWITTYDFHGDHEICSGLCNSLIHAINKHFDETKEDLDSAP